MVAEIHYRSLSLVQAAEKMAEETYKNATSFLVGERDAFRAWFGGEDFHLLAAQRFADLLAGSEFAYIDLEPIITPTVLEGDKWLATQYQEQRRTKVAAAGSRIILADVTSASHQEGGDMRPLGFLYHSDVD